MALPFLRRSISPNGATVGKQLSVSSIEEGEFNGQHRLDQQRHFRLHRFRMLFEEGSAAEMPSHQRPDAQRVVVMPGADAMSNSIVAARSAAERLVVRKSRAGQPAPGFAGPGHTAAQVFGSDQL